MVTIKDVARHAGVSIATVSRVINRSPTVTEQSVQQVQRAIEELGYQPSSIARSLQLGRSGLLGMIVPQLDHPFFSRLVQAVERQCEAEGCHLMLCCSDSSEAKERDFVQALRRSRVDGILMASRTPNLSYRRDCDIPVVGVERSVSEHTPFVACDNYQGGVLAAQALLACGAQHPAVLQRPSFQPQGASFMPGDLRARGFLDECARAGVPCTAAQPDNSFGDQKAACVTFLHDLLTAHPETDALFTTSDVTAAWACAAFAERGIRVPEQMQVIGFDGIDAAAYLQISTIAQPIIQMGQEAVRLLLRLIAQQDIPQQTVLPVQLILRRSTRAPVHRQEASQ